MSSLSHTSRRRRNVSRVPRAKLTIRMDAERDGAIPLVELANIARSLQLTIDQITRALNDRTGQGRPPGFLKRLSALEAVGIEPGSAVLEIEAPHDMEQFAIDFEREDAGVQAMQLFVVSIDALSRGDDPPAEIGQPATKSIQAFARAVGGHDRVWLRTEVGAAETVASFDPRMLSVEIEESDPIRDVESSREFVGVLYGVNLHTRIYRVEDGLAKTHIFKLSDELDDPATASLLGKVVLVRAVATDLDDKDSDKLVAVGIERVDAPETSDYYTWDFEKALAGVEPIKSLSDLAIEGLDGEEFDAFWEAVNE